MLRNSCLAVFFRQPSASLLNSLPTTATAWDRLLGDAYKECVLPLLARQSQERGLTPAIPFEIKEVFDVAETLNEDRNRLMICESVYVAKLLNQIGIRPVALKGLAYLLTGVCSSKSGSRYLHDIDLLVPKDQAGAAFDHLLANGYRENHADYFASIRHHYPGISRPGLPTLELHSQIALGICDRILPSRPVMAATRLLSIEGAQFLIPSPTHLIVHLIIHSQLAHPYEERLYPPMRALLDLVLIQKHFGEEIDWVQIAGMFRRAGQFGTLALFLKVADKKIGFRLPANTFEAHPELERIFTKRKLNLWLQLRWQRRCILNRWPGIRFIDPVYLVMSLFSRRMRLLPAIVRKPHLILKLIRSFVRFDFYRKLFST